MDFDRLYDTDESIGPNTEEKPSRGTNRRKNFDESRSAIAEIFACPARQVLVEWACDAYANEDQRWYNKSQLSEETGLSRQAIYEHIEPLVDLGVLDTEGNKRKKY